jgi:hypothetical protein
MTRNVDYYYQINISYTFHTHPTQNVYLFFSTNHRTLFIGIIGKKNVHEMKRKMYTI